MRPVRNQILVKPFPPNELTQGGLVVPDSVKKPSNKVTIVDVGNGTASRPMRLKRGDVGFRVKAWGQEVLIDGESFFLMEDNAILALQ